ncbi:MAG: LytTR family DNA-binding domain-containing protein [Ignavibacteriaceae bacterium]
MKIRTIIVDDEPLAREGIKLRLAEDKDICLVGEYGNGTDAVKAINNNHPDLVFLDIQIPGMDGFEVIERITVSPIPFIIFVTAYDKYAIKAFEVRALDYLLKPINDTRFTGSLVRAKEEIQNNALSTFEKKIKSLITAKDISSDKITSKKIERIAVKSKAGYSLLNVEEIEWIEAAGDYVYLHCRSKKHLHRETMSNIEESLSSSDFLRIHRSVIVNMNKVKEIQAEAHGDYYVYLLSGSKVKLSRNYKEKFLSVLKIAL